MKEAISERSSHNLEYGELMSANAEDTLLSDCDAREIEMAACQAYQFAHSLLQPVSEISNEQASTAEGESTAFTDKTASNKSKKAQDAIEWLQMAIRLLEREGCMGNLQDPPSTGTEKRLRSHHVRSPIALSYKSSLTVLCAAQGDESAR